MPPAQIMDNYAAARQEKRAAQSRHAGDRPVHSASAGLQQPSSDFYTYRYLATEALRFVEALLRDCFGFASLATIEPVVIDGRSYPIGLAGFRRPRARRHRPGGRRPRYACRSFGDGGRRRSAFGLAQEYLNAADGAHVGHRLRRAHAAHRARQRQPDAPRVDRGRPRRASSPRSATPTSPRSGCSRTRPASAGLASAADGVRARSVARGRARGRDASARAPARGRRGGAARARPGVSRAPRQSARCAQRCRTAR